MCMPAQSCRSLHHCTRCLVDLDYRSASALVEIRPGRTDRNYARGAFTARRLHAFATATLARPHPSQQAAYLPCARPPDWDLPFRPRWSTPSSHRSHRVFVTTCAGTDTMAGEDDDCDISVTSRPQLPLAFPAVLKGTLQHPPCQLTFKPCSCLIPLLR